MKDDDLIKEAKKNFERVAEWESQARDNYSYDTKFFAGDSSNMYQWPIDVQRARNASSSICLTVNKTAQHCLQIINDARQNESQIEIRPIGNGATFKSAEIFEGIVRYIENQSNAQAAYSDANFCQVVGGWGYLRVTTDYAHDDTFDQEIYIKRIADPLSVYLDPDIAEFDGSDAKFGLITRDMTNDEFEDTYGKKVMDGLDGSSPLGTGMQDGWQDDDHIRVCEYYRKVEGTDTLHELKNGDVVRESEVKKQPDFDDDTNGESLLDTLKKMSVRKRDIPKPTIEWYLIAGSKVIDKKEWPGKYIPIVRVVGTEMVIDRILDRKGHVRSLIDPQRLYNFWTSGAAEAVALTTKTPYIAPAEAIEGYEEIWKNANLQNNAILTYNGMTDDGKPIAPPERVQPPVMAPAYISGMQIAQQEMMMASGQYEANLGQKSNEVSGRAVQERRRQGENSTYHFIDHFSQALTFLGRILVDLIPKIYDVPRITKILGQDGVEQTIQVDPNHPEAHTQKQDPDDEDNFNPQEISAIFNPSVGRYAVVADIGPAYETRRQETAQALMQLMSQNKELAAVAGDLLFKASDFHMADIIAKRLKNMVPKQALGQDQPDPQVQQLQMMLAKQHEQMTDMQQKLNVSQQKAAQHDPNLEWYDAETRRMTAVSKIDPEALRPIVRELVSQALGTPVNPIIAQHAAETEAMPGSDTQLANQQHAQQMAQMQAQQQHEAGMQGSQQQAAAQSQDNAQQHAADMAESAAQQAKQTNQGE